MDNTAGLRRLKPTIDACKNGEVALASKKLPEAERQFATALRYGSQDYAANVLMARCLASQGKRAEALRYADAARGIYPQEAQAHKLVGTLKLQAKDPSAAYREFDAYDRLLPGDPGITFLKGVSLDAMGERQQAAAHYRTFLRSGATGEPAKFANGRLQALGAAR